jgi:hypothetical protein
VCVCEREGESVPFRTKEGKGGEDLMNALSASRERGFFFSPLVFSFSLRVSLFIPSRAEPLSG